MNSPSTSQVRQWAREQGMPVGDRGRIPADLVAQYLAAHGRARPAATSTKGRRTPAPPAPPAPRASSEGVTIGRTIHAKPRWDWAR